MSARATVGHLQLFQNKMIDARQMLGWNWSRGGGGGAVGKDEGEVLKGRYGHAQANQSINQLYLNTVNGSASWFSDMPCDNYNL